MTTPTAIQDRKGLGHPKVYLVKILDGSGESTSVDSAWSLRKLAEERLSQCRKEYDGLDCWIEELLLNPDSKRNGKGQ